MNQLFDDPAPLRKVSRLEPMFHSRAVIIHSRLVQLLAVVL